MLALFALYQNSAERFGSNKPTEERQIGQAKVQSTDVQRNGPPAAPQSGVIEPERLQEDIVAVACDIDTDGNVAPSRGRIHIAEESAAGMIFIHVVEANVVDGRVSFLVPSNLDVGFGELALPGFLRAPLVWTPAGECHAPPLRTSCILSGRVEGRLDGTALVKGCGGVGVVESHGDFEVDIDRGALPCVLQAIRRDGSIVVPGSERVVDGCGVGAFPLYLPVEEWGGIGVSLGSDDRGVVIEAVVPGLPADLAGLEEGDVILAANGDALDAGLAGALRVVPGPVGTEVTIEMADGRTVEVSRVPTGQ